MNTKLKTVIVLAGVLIPPIAMMLKYNSIAVADHLTGIALIEKMVRGFLWGAVIDLGIAVIITAISLLIFIFAPFAVRAEDEDIDGVEEGIGE